MAWLNGLDAEKLQKLRRQTDRRYGAAIVAAARSAADYLRPQQGKLKLQQVVDETCSEREVDDGAVSSYLAALGLLLLVCTHEDWE